MPSDTTALLKVTLGKADISKQVIRVDIEDVDRGADKATFLMEDPGSTNSDRVERLMDVRIELGWETEYALAFVGQVSSIQSKADSGGRGRLEVTCIDKSYLFMERPAIDKRQHVGKLKDILSAMATRVGIALGDVLIDPMPEFTKDKPLNQLDRTDWQMLQDLAEEYRARAFVEVNAGDKDSEEVKKAGGEPKLYFVSEEALLAQEPMGTLLYCRGMGKLLEFDYTRTSSGASPLGSAAVANPDSGQPESLAAVPAPAEPKVPPKDSTDRVEKVLGPAAAADQAAAEQNVQDAPVKPADKPATKEMLGAPSDPALAERKVKQDRTRMMGFSGKGTAMGTVFLRAKGSVKIEGISSMAAGRWYVTRVNHVYERAEIDKKVSVSFRSKLVATR
ncbi:MAG TPA: hypothetical protein VF759_10385 [Allosphingosinicella sp.]|jgi:hypothetical protein